MFTFKLLRVWLELCTAGHLWLMLFVAHGTSADSLCCSGTCYYQGPRFSAANFAKFHGTVCEILQYYYSPIPYIPRPTDNTSKYKEFIVTCKTKTHYIRPLKMKIHVIILIIIKSKLATTSFYCFINGKKLKRSLKKLN